MAIFKGGSWWFRGSVVGPRRLEPDVRPPAHSPRWLPAPANPHRLHGHLRMNPIGFFFFVAHDLFPSSGQITIIYQPELRPFGDDSPY